MIYFKDNLFKKMYIFRITGIIFFNDSYELYEGYHISTSDVLSNVLSSF